MHIDGTPQSRPGRSRWLHRVAGLMRRYPWIGALGQRVYRLNVPRYSLGVVGVLLDERRERVLLVEHVFHPVYPWGLPGGWLDRGEDPAQTVIREFREETGLRVRPVLPVQVERVPAMPGQMDITYLCTLDGASQAIRLSSELLNYQWAALDALPPLLEAQRRAIAAARSIAANTNGATGQPGGEIWTTDG